MKVIFLDLEGPLLNNGMLINNALHCLNELVRLTEAKIVITSDKRIGKNLEQIKSIISSTLGENISNKVIGMTEAVYYKDVEISRAAEIQLWLDSNTNITNYVIIDGSESAALLSSSMKFVKVGDAGITGEVFREALRILG